MELVKQLIDGELRDIKTSCISQAYRTFAERSATDANPRIVQMQINGALVDHWYYRSDNWIDQPFSHSSGLVAYVGEAEGDVPEELGEGTYLVDKESTEDIQLGVDLQDEDPEYLEALLA